MKRYFFLLFAVLLIIGIVLPASAVAAHTESEPFTTNLIAGQNEYAGDVSVWNDGDNLYVKYETAGDWIITETHL